MKEGLNDIYYITGERVASVSFSPFLETYRQTYRKTGLEVLYMVDPIGVQQIKVFDDKKLNFTR